MSTKAEAQASQAAGGNGSTVCPLRVEILTLEGNAVLDADAGTQAQVVGSVGSFEFTEGPTWVPRLESWIFSDIPANKQYIFSPATGDVKLHREDSNNANGNFLDAGGCLLTCEHKTRCLKRYDLVSGESTTLASDFQGGLLNSPNDVIQSHLDGAIYFTDPDYGTIPTIGHGSALQQSTNNVFRLDAKTGDVTVLADDFVRPNGLALNSSETLMYIADSGASTPTGFDASLPHHVRVFQVEDGGKRLSNGRIFCTIADDNGVPDGVRVDQDGNVWISVKSGVDVYSMEGTMIARIQTPETTANASFGGTDGSDMMITASTSVFIIPTKVRGGGDVRK